MGTWFIDAQEFPACHWVIERAFPISCGAYAPRRSHFRRGYVYVRARAYARLIPLSRPDGGPSRTWTTRVPGLTVDTRSRRRPFARRRIRETCHDRYLGKWLRRQVVRTYIYGGTPLYLSATLCLALRNGTTAIREAYRGA